MWSFGEENYEILKKFLLIREQLRPYVRACMKVASESGSPVMRPMFYNFPKEERCYEAEDQYMFGSKLLVAPVMQPHVTTRSVYLPGGRRWKETATGKVFDGGRSVEAYAPIDVIPVFESVSEEMIF